MKTEGKVLASIAAALFVLTFLAATAYAEPKTLNFHGRLLYSYGSPITTIKKMTFTIYNAPDGGTELWSETKSAAIISGSFNVPLGRDTAFPDTVSEGQNIYIDIKVYADAKMTPIKQVTVTGTDVALGDMTLSQHFSPPEQPPEEDIVKILKADFSASATAIGVNNSVKFKDLTRGSPASWTWDFGDTGTSTLQNPSHTYAAEGTYTVSLTAGDGTTSHTETRAGYITAYPFPPGTITAVDSAGVVGSFTSISKGADGLPVMSYYDSANQDLKVLHCGNASCSSGNTITPVDSIGNVGDYSSLAIGTDGRPIVSYWDGTKGNLRVAHCGNASCSSGNTIIPVDSSGYVGQYTSIAIGADGLPVISYWDGTNGDLKVAHCGDASCSSGNTITPVDTAGTVGWYTSIAIGADGLPVISYFDNTNQDLKVAHCGNASCSSGNTISKVDSRGYVGFDSSIAIGADGLPIVSYYDGTKSNLKVAKCRNATCSKSKSRTINKANSPKDVGYYTSIAIGADGLPVVSYFDYTNKDLKVAHCGDASCSSGNVINTVDSPGYVGAYNSITIGADGLPIVSYYDYTNFDLKVACCRDAYCSVWHLPPGGGAPSKD
jgi:PKD repeat protein